MNIVLESIARFDEEAFRWVLGKRHARRLARVWRWVSHLGDGLPYVFLGLGLYWLEPEHGGAFLVTGLLAFAFELPVYWSLKNTIRRDRPQDSLTDFVAHIVPSDQFSFPSGHAAAACVMATLVAAFYPEFIWPALAFSALIGSSRVLLGVHFPTDVLAGALLGHLSAVLALALGL